MMVLILQYLDFDIYQYMTYHYTDTIHFEK